MDNEHKMSAGMVSSAIYNGWQIHGKFSYPLVLAIALVTNQDLINVHVGVLFKDRKSTVNFKPGEDESMCSLTI